MHKFLILIDNSYCAHQDLLSQGRFDLIDQLYLNADGAQMFIIECSNPVFKDNTFDIDKELMPDFITTRSFVKDINGRIYAFLDYKSKSDLNILLDSVN